MLKKKPFPNSKKISGSLSSSTRLVKHNSSGNTTIWSWKDVSSGWNNKGNSNSVGGRVMKFKILLKPKHGNLA